MVQDGMRVHIQAKSTFKTKPKYLNMEPNPKHEFYSDSEWQIIFSKEVVGL